MNSDQLRTILESPYKRSDWEEILKDNFGVAKLASNPEKTGAIKDLNSDLATNAYELGSFDTTDGRLIGIYEVVVAPQIQLHRNRIGLRNLLNKIIKESVDGALIVFVQADKWRFSYVSEVYTRDNANNRELRKTDPRRYTYLFGKGERAKTATDRFLGLGNTIRGGLGLMIGLALKDLESAFNVEKMSKGFFESYRNHYDKFVAFLTGEDRKGNVIGTASSALRSAFNGDQKCARDFVKKLLGRIVFLYFLEKKGWLGVPQEKAYGNGDEDFLHRLFRDFKEQDAFYAGALVPLFFETLNKKRAEDHFRIEPSLFKTTGWNKLKIPFLNGGLFEPDAEDNRLEIVFPKSYFADLFQFFDQYNFTVYEDSPEEHTVAVDPEMLGHIFENLLEDNKDKGAFYTPKEIVHYMCQESLIAYLVTRISPQVPDCRQGIENFIQGGTAGDITPYTEELLIALKEVKICDPAIGSGAFPMGLLIEILHAVEVLWNAAPDATARIWNISSEKWQPALVKASVIQHSIYGVDIEQGAVDIARLRFWLSLVVDEDEPQPLPNLDYKIVVGNSLISKYDDLAIDIDWHVKITKSMSDASQKAEDLQQSVVKKLEELVKKQKEYFDYKGAKNVLQREIRDLKIEVLLAQLQLNKYKSDKDKSTQGSIFGEVKMSKASIKKAEDAVKHIPGFVSTMGKLRTLKTTNGILDYFDWKLDFPEVMNEEVAAKTGFDIVIGNPPYIQLQNDGGKLSKLYENSKFQTFARTGDIYSLFYEKGWQILKPAGHLIYITSNKWMRAGYGESTRKFFAENTDPMLLVDFAGQKIFESATVDTNILLFAKDKNRQKTNACTVKEKVLDKLSDYISQYRHTSPFADSKSWVILSDIEQRIKTKIEAVGTPLKEWNVQINYGIKTGLNEAFIIDGKKREELIAEDPKSAEIIRPILRGRDIKRYSYEFADLWIINTHNGIKEKGIPPVDIDDYPAIKKHLDCYSPGLENRADKGKTPYNLRNCAYTEDFDKQKIVWGEISDRTKFCMDLEGKIAPEATTFLLTGKSLLYLLGYLNSKISEYLFSKIGTTTGVGTVRWKKFTIEQLLVPTLTDKEEEDYNKLVTLLINNQEVNHVEIGAQIDKLIYRSLGLTKEEVSFVEGYC